MAGQRHRERCPTEHIDEHDGSDQPPPATRAPTLKLAPTLRFVHQETDALFAPVHDTPAPASVQVIVYAWLVTGENT